MMMCLFISQLFFTFYYTRKRQCENNDISVRQQCQLPVLFTQIHRVLFPDVIPLVLLMFYRQLRFIYYHIVQCQTAHDAVCIFSCCCCRRNLKIHNFYFLLFTFHIPISIGDANSRVRKTIIRKKCLKYSAILTVVGFHAEFRFVATKTCKQNSLYPELLGIRHWFLLLYFDL